jgi:hypothetical protein
VISSNVFKDIYILWIQIMEKDVAKIRLLFTRHGETE